MLKEALIELRWSYTGHGAKISEVVDQLKNQLALCREHASLFQWLNPMHKIDSMDGYSFRCNLPVNRFLCNCQLEKKLKLTIVLKTNTW
jgi:hypothetical protein